jgi:threonine dehydrogenase-like Zn-dependent dehydrogenase
LRIRIPPTAAGTKISMFHLTQVSKPPAGVDADDPAMIEPLAVAVHSAGLARDLAGKNVLIVGGGTIGNLIAQTVHLSRPKKIAVMEKIPFRREVLSDVGFYTLKGSEDGTASSVREAFDGGAPDVAFECAGSGCAADICIRTVRRGERWSWWGSTSRRRRWKWSSSGTGNRSWGGR